MWKCLNFEAFLYQCMYIHTCVEAIYVDSMASTCRLLSNICADITLSAAGARQEMRWEAHRRALCTRIEQQQQKTTGSRFVCLSQCVKDNYNMCVHTHRDCWTVGQLARKGKQCELRRESILFFILFCLATS